MKHIEIAHEIIDYLHLVFPNDSIAIAGSVADGTFKKNSDIDLLLLSERLKCTLFRIPSSLKRLSSTLHISI